MADRQAPLIAGVFAFLRVESSTIESRRGTAIEQPVSPDPTMRAAPANA
jgi:hypothetical protein